MTIKTRFGKRCVFNGNRLKGILLEGETLDEFIVRTTHVREKLPVGRHETKRKKYILYGIMDKTLIGTVIII